MEVRIKGMVASLPTIKSKLTCKQLYPLQYVYRSHYCNYLDIKSLTLAVVSYQTLQIHAITQFLIYTLTNYPKLMI